MNNESVYEERFIAFIDILGFREHIRLTENDPEHAQKIHSVLGYIFELKKDNDQGTLSLKGLGVEVSVFSDSIVISYPTKNSGALYSLIQDIIYIQIDMMLKGILMRGGVTVGDVFHEDNMVYGPAMIGAYDLESKKAIYPRVIIDENVIEKALENPENEPEDEREYINSLLKKDTDNHLFINFLEQEEMIDDMYDYLVLLQKTKKLIEKQLKSINNPNVLRKYNWLKHYYNSTVEKFPKLIEDNPSLRVVDMPENISDIYEYL